MKIPRQFHQFKNEIALLVVTGSDALDIYLAQEGKLERLIRYREPIPHYLDREEFFTQSGPGKEGLIGSGSVYESKNNLIQHRLQKKIAKEISETFKRNLISTIYILSPDYYLKQVEKAVPKIQRDKVRAKIPENLAGKKELDVIKVVSRYFEKILGQSEPRDKATNKLLKGTDEIRKKIGKKKT